MERSAKSRPVWSAGPEVHFQAADVNVQHVFQRVAQFLASGIGTGALQAFHQHLGARVAFEHGLRDVRQALGGGEVVNLIYDALDSRALKGNT